MYAKKKNNIPVSRVIIIQREKNGKISRRWTPQDQEMLTRLVNEKGFKWTELIRVFPDRSARAIKEQYQKLSKKKPWTTEEQQRLVDYVKSQGSKWSKLATYFPGRSVSDLKNQYYFLFPAGKKSKRVSFDQHVKKTVKISSNQDRRHIIPYKLMSDALFRWKNQHQSSSLNVIEAIKNLNNSPNNLYPGEKEYNRALGMLMNRTFTSLEEVQKFHQHPSGFEPATQQDLLFPYTELETDYFADSEFRTDFSDNMYFDWPYGYGTSQEMFETWNYFYLEFIRMRDQPETFTEENVIDFIETFKETDGPVYKAQ